jgi:hypothetical protein
VSGTITYAFLPAVYDPVSGAGGFATATERPVRNAVVQAMRGSTVLGAPTSTDATGHYTLTFTDPGGADALGVAVLARTAGAPSIQVQDNTDAGCPAQCAVWAAGAALDASSTTLDLHATSGWTGTHFDAATRTAAPFAILDAMYTASMAFVAVRPSVTYPALAVNWSPANVPEAGDKAAGQIGTSHYAPAENQIYILGADQLDTDEFDSHVIVHEWGHFFEHNLSRSDSPGGAHTFGDVLDPRIAFGEGYGNALAAMLLPESMYVDTNWSGPGGTLAAFGFDAETDATGDDPNPSAFSEASVMRLLYDLFDPANEPFDGVQLGLGTIYDVLTGHQRSTPYLTTIGSFVTGVRALGGVSTTALNDLLAAYEIGPITTDYGTGDVDPWGSGTGGLERMYVHVAGFPATESLQLGGTESHNKWSQNQYYWFTGTGGTVTVQATSTADIMLQVYEGGVDLGYVDDVNGAGTESVSGPTLAGTIYVVDVVGFPTPNVNDITLEFTSP